MKSTYDHLLEWLIELNQENRKRFEREEIMLSSAKFVFDFGTVKLDIGRAVGKTQFIKNHATGDDLIFTFGQQQVFEFTKVTKAIVFNNNGDSPDKLRGIKFKTIYVDEPHLTFSNNDIWPTLSKIIYNTKQTIVILGS